MVKKHVLEGGFTTTIGQAIMFALKDVVGPALYYGLISLGQMFFKIWPSEDPGSEWYWFSDWTYGYFWKYLYWCFKSILYLCIFAIAGPIVTLIGIAILYRNLGNKFLIVIKMF